MRVEEGRKRVGVKQGREYKRKEGRERGSERKDKGLKEACGLQFHLLDPQTRGAWTNEVILSLRGHNIVAFDVIKIMKKKTVANRCCDGAHCAVGVYMQPSNYSRTEVECVDVTTALGSKSATAK